MPFTFNAGSTGFDWKAALSALMEARAARFEKTVEQKAPAPTEATKTQAAAEPAVRIDISEAAKAASAPAATETVAAAVEVDAAPVVMSPTTEETTEAAAQAAAPLAVIAEETASEAAAVTEQVVAKVTSLAGLGASPSAEKTGRTAATAPAEAAEAEVSDIAAARAAVIRLQELDRMQNMVSSIGARPESDMGIAPINAQSASRVGAAYGASAATPAAAGERTDIAA